MAIKKMFRLLWKLPRRGARKLTDFLVRKGGGVYLAATAYNDLRATQASALAELIRLEAATSKLVPGLSGIIFSKDRALQVHALLTSYFTLVTHPAPLTVLYHATTPAHAKAYQEVAELFAQSPATVTFLREEPGKGFRSQLLDVLDGIQTRNMFFLVDDIVFIRPLDLTLASRLDPLEAMLCLRLSPSITTSDMVHNPSRQPTFKAWGPPAGSGVKADGALAFRWYEGTNDWAYPYSVDGNIFSTVEMRVLARLGRYKAPNTLEVALMKFADFARERPGLCYPESKMVNLPINLVQTEITTNNAGTTDAETLLKAWQDGLTFDTGVLRTFVPTSPHENFVLPLVKRDAPQGSTSRRQQAIKRKQR